MLHLNNFAELMLSKCININCIKVSKTVCHSITLTGLSSKLQVKENLKLGAIWLNNIDSVYS